MHRLTKLAAILGFGMAVELATIAQAQVTPPVAPLPGPYQIIIAPPQPVQLQQRQQQPMRPNWANPQNNAQALPYWMQNRAAPGPNAPVNTGTNVAPNSPPNAAAANVASANQNRQRWANQAAAAASNMLTTPGYFPGYVAPPNMNNRGTNPAFANQPQYRPPIFQNGPLFNQGNMRNTGPYFGQIMPPQMQQWGGYNPAFGPNRPPNGYGPPPGYGGYSPAPNR